MDGIHPVSKLPERERGGMSVANLGLPIVRRIILAVPNPLDTNSLAVSSASTMIFNDDPTPDISTGIWHGFQESVATGADPLTTATVNERGCLVLDGIWLRGNQY